MYGNETFHSVIKTVSENVYKQTAVRLSAIVRNKPEGSKATLEMVNLLENCHRVWEDYCNTHYSSVCHYGNVK